MGQISKQSGLNPNAPVFIPAAQLQVEDFSPEWWELVTNSTWFRDHWLGELKEDDMFCNDGNNNTEEDEIESFFDDFLEAIDDNSIQTRNRSLKVGERSILRRISEENDGKGLLHRQIKGWEKPAQCVRQKCMPKIIQQPR